MWGGESVLDFGFGFSWGFNWSNGMVRVTFRNPSRLSMVLRISDGNMDYERNDKVVDVSGGFDR